MVIFALWQRIPGDPSPEDVAAGVQALVAPVLSEPPNTRILQSASATLVSLELPVRGWKPSPFQEDERTWVLAPNYPVGADRALAAHGLPVRDETAALPALCRALQDDPAPVLRELAPPFSLIWCDKPSGVMYVQNDGLGQAQLFEYRQGRRWALTNRILALETLGIAIVIEPEEWAVRLTIGWFPLESTGYRGVSFLEPAVQMALDGGRDRRRRFDVLGDWVSPGPLSREDCLELARHSLASMIEAATALWNQPSVGLSGGWDTRAVVAVMRSLGVPFEARVRAKPGRYDGRIASELARLGGFDLHLKEDADVPLGGSAGYRRSIALALRWQAGYMETTKHRSFRASDLTKPLVNVMGQHGEIGRAYYSKRAFGLEDGQAEERIVERIMSRGAPFLRDRLRAHVREVIREAIRQADRYGLTGPQRLDFFYLYERTRRWASGSLSSQTSFVFAPFLNPGYVRAAFGYPGDDKDTNPFHRHIVAMHAPEWTDVPYARDLPPQQVDQGKAGRVWETVAEPIVREALAHGGMWTEILSPDLVAADWTVAPDQVAIAHLMGETVEARMLYESGVPAA